MKTNDRSILSLQLRHVYLSCRIAASAVRKAALDSVRWLRMSTDERRYDQLTRAAERGDLHAVRDALERGAPVNAPASWKGGDGELYSYASEPLFCAAWFGLVDVAWLLLERGASISGQNSSGWTLLHAAAQSDETRRRGDGTSKRAVIELLLHAGVDPGVRDVAGRQAIDLVGEAEREIRELLQCHAAAATFNQELPTPSNGHVRTRL